MKWIFKALFLVLLFSLFSFYFAVMPFRILSHHTPQDFNLAYEDISITARDGVILKGWYVPAKKPTKKAIILLHGYPADKGNILPVMHFLQERYNLLFMDSRYFGASGGYYTTVGKKETQDTLSAIAYLKQRGMKDIGLWGLSMGGAVALMAAAESPDVNMVAADSAYARLDWVAAEHFKIPLVRNVMALLMRGWGLLLLQMDINTVNPADAVAKLKIPVLIIYSRDDDLIPKHHGELLAERAKENPNAQIIVFDDLRHGEIASNYEKILEKFFSQL